MCAVCRWLPATLGLSTGGCGRRIDRRWPCWGGLACPQQHRRRQELLLTTASCSAGTQCSVYAHRLASTPACISRPPPLQQPAVARGGDVHRPLPLRARLHRQPHHGAVPEADAVLRAGRAASVTTADAVLHRLPLIERASNSRAATFRQREQPVRSAVGRPRTEQQRICRFCCAAEIGSSFSACTTHFPCNPTAHNSAGVRAAAGTRGLAWAGAACHGTCCG